MSRKSDRQQAIHRAKEAYALWHLYGRKAEGFMRVAPLEQAPDYWYHYEWQGWHVTLKPNGSLRNAWYDVHSFPLPE